jgi:hypothetical protein
MRMTMITAALMMALAPLALGCGGSDKKVIRSESIQAAPVAPAVVEKRTTVIEEDD